MSTPSGVHTFGHKHKSDKGSKHPSSIGPGLEKTSGEGGSSPEIPSYTKGSDGHLKSVVRGDGTETRRGTKVVHKQKTGGSIPSGDKESIPSGVKQHSGLKAPKSVK